MIYSLQAKLEEIEDVQIKGAILDEVEAIIQGASDRHPEQVQLPAKVVTRGRKRKQAPKERKTTVEKINQSHEKESHKRKLVGDSNDGAHDLPTTYVKHGHFQRRVNSYRQ